MLGIEAEEGVCSPVPGEARLTLADPVHRVAGCSVMTEAVVETARTKPARRTGLGTVLTHPTSWAPAGARHVVTLPSVLTGALTHTPPAICPRGARLATERSREARGTLTAARPVVTGAVT